MKKVDKQLVSEFTSSKKDELLKTREILKNSVDEFGIKWRTHLPVFLGPSEIARILWFDHLFRLIVNVPGVIVEFGSQFGASLTTISNLSQIHDPWNASRRIFSFSTFGDGFVSIDRNIDGFMVETGDYATGAKWKDTLESILILNSLSSPIMNKVRLVEGDATLTFEEFLEQEPSLLISFVHFDMDLYKPTKKVLEICLDRMPKGSLLVFDEINHPGFPGETIALNEVLGIRNLKLERTSFQPYSAYVIL
jgi:hypothetical protein